MREGSSNLLKIAKPFVEAASTYDWNEKEGLAGVRQLLLRAILIKQFESLEAINAPGKAGNIVVPLLRPMYEELIWLE